MARQYGVAGFGWAGNRLLAFPDQNFPIDEKTDAVQEHWDAAGPRFSYGLLRLATSQWRRDYSTMSNALTDNRIVVFDGLCNLCSGGARWLEHHQAKPPFLLVPMQSDHGRAALAQHGYDPDDPLTFLVLDGRQCLTQSDAWIHLIVAAGGGWRLIRATRVVPRAWRDYVYRLIARNRYRWFGRRKTCYLPQPSMESSSPREPFTRSGS